MSSGLYEIEIAEYSGYNVDERSGVYFGELKEILPRISDGVDDQKYIKVRKIKPKVIDMSLPKKGVNFYCYDKNLKKELDFCVQGQDEDYFVYIPEDTKRIFTFQDKILEEGDGLVFIDEYGDTQSGKILWFDHDNDKIKVNNGYMCYTVDPMQVVGVYD